MRRGLLVLAVLIGVLAMHGVAFLVGQQHPSGVEASAHSTGDAMPEPAPDAVAQVLPATSSAVGAGDAMPEPGGAPDHETPGHLWSLCLAVLAAIAVMTLVVLGGRLPPVGRRAGPRIPHGPRGGFLLLRPPDLSVLCLLRI